MCTLCRIRLKIDDKTYTYLNLYLKYELIIMLNIIDLLCNIRKYLDHVTRFYFSTCQINPDYLIDIRTDSFESEINKFIQSCMSPSRSLIIKEICTYSLTRISKIQFLKKFSP